MQARSRRVFMAVQAAGCVLIFVGSAYSLVANVAGLLLLLPGSLIVSYPLSRLDTADVHGMLWSDVLYLPCACLVNVLLVMTFVFFRKMRASTKAVKE